MASTTARVAVPFEDFAAHVAHRRAETGVIELSRNAGNRRTERARALVKAIEDAGATW